MCLCLRLFEKLFLLAVANFIEISQHNKVEPCLVHSIPISFIACACSPQGSFVVFGPLQVGLKLERCTREAANPIHENCLNGFAVNDSVNNNGRNEAFEEEVEVVFQCAVSDARDVKNDVPDTQIQY